MVIDLGGQLARAGADRLVVVTHGPLLPSATARLHDGKPLRRLTPHR
ncbi:hypothetical protein [Nocardia huaxiensis]|nr:hypothetical protein [Nocardia huaxiensis]UFS97953.1 hypothetical protein LPY97_08670 [Nocardia huaxiensis]